MPAAEQLEFVAKRFNTVEINRTFYSLVKPAWFRRLREQTPEGFQFAVKGSRFISHMKKLSGVEVPLANFFASGLLELGAKLGPILWQLPANFPPDNQRLRSFFETLPRTHSELSDLASTATREEIDLVRSSSPLPLRYALEVRSEDLFTDEVRELATEFGVSLAVSHSSRWPSIETNTTDFMYFRLHGPKALYASSYSEEELAGWARRVDYWRTLPGRAQDVYVFFDNDGRAYAPRNAARLLEVVSSTSPDSDQE
jgi:uncharacterized protein YecE (DUF72 family)